MNKCKNNECTVQICCDTAVSCPACGEALEQENPDSLAHTTLDQAIVAMKQERESRALYGEEIEDSPSNPLYKNSYGEPLFW
tara:strand:+ start:517 stop:762 length:246 start_codon:yes stop_codon:yes gene_type:complete